LNGNNSPSIEWIHTKFDTDTENKVLELVSVAKLISHKIQDGGNCDAVSHCGRNWAIVAYICTKFETDDENVPQIKIYRQN